MAVVYNYGASPTYVKIASYSIGSSMSSYTFSNLPQGYTDLIVNLEITGSGNGTDAYFQFNGDTATNYNSAWMRGISNAVTTIASTGATGTRLGDGGSQTTGNTALITANIQNYSSSLLYKNVIFRTDNASRGLDMGVSVWRSNNPITSLKVYLGAGNLTSGIINIYGIKAALVPKASGGDIIVQDGSYWYHAFLRTSAFTPKQTITADVMVLAGGSGGFRGPGGAGGFRVLTGQSLVPSSVYTATVGAGSAESYTGNNSSFAGTGLTTINATGGGMGGSAPGSGASGGSGGGGARSGAAGSYNGGAGNAGGYTPVEGYAGGNASTTVGSYMDSGGGGGAGGVGSNAASAGKGGAGGVGTSAYSSWGLITNTGHNVSGTVYYAGGGGGTGSDATTAAVGGNGGGGAGEGSSAASVNGLAGTGGGGGAGYFRRYSFGGSGVIIVRYPI